MATNPAALLAAANIFGGVGNLFTGPNSLIGALTRKPGEDEARMKAMGFVRSPSGAWIKPPQPNADAQGGNEPDLVYNARRVMTAPFGAAQRAIDTPFSVGSAVQQDVRKAVGEQFSTPNERKRKAAAAGSPFPQSYADPAWDQFEAAYAQGAGNPTLADQLARLRTQGERSNSNQVSSAGARTPYQITPQTRKGIMDKYGFDPWSSPQNAVRGAAIAASTYTGLNANYNDPQVIARSAGGYFGGKAGADNPWSAASDGGATVANYTQRVLGPNTQLPFPALNPYDPNYDKQALAELGKARQAAMTPFSMSMDIGPAPEMPKPSDVPKTDFTQSDADLQAMKPVFMDEAEIKQRQRDGFWQGIGKAMMGMSGNEGPGTLLMKLAGGALSGKYAARDEIRQEEKEFDAQMLRWQEAVYRNDYNKANIIQNEAAQQVQRTDDYNMKNWVTKYNQWAKSGSIDIQGTNAVITQQSPDGHISVRTVPIRPMVDVAFSQQRANIFSSMGGRQMGGNQQITGVANAFSARQAIAALGAPGNSPAENDAAAAMAPAFYGSFIASHGLTSDFLGPDQAKALEDDVAKRLLAQQMVPGSKDYNDARDKMMATELAKIGLADPAQMRRMMQVGSAANSFVAMQRMLGTSTRTAVDAQGRPTQSTTTAGLDAADIFQ